MFALFQRCSKGYTKFTATDYDLEQRGMTEVPVIKSIFLQRLQHSGDFHHESTAPAKRGYKTGPQSRGKTVNDIFLTK